MAEEILDDKVEELEEKKKGVLGKVKDDLQDIMGRIKEENLGIPIQFENFRD